MPSVNKQRPRCCKTMSVLGKHGLAVLATASLVRIS